VFNLLRFFSLVSAIVVIAVTTAMVILYNRHEMNRLIEFGEMENVALTRSFANSIWPQYSSYITSVQETGGDALRSREETVEISDNLKVLAAGLPVLKVKIYNRRGVTVFSSDPRQIGDDRSGNPNFIRALNGSPASDLIYRDDGAADSRDMISSYVPVHTSDGNVAGVFELYTDVTALLDKVKRTTTRVTVGLFTVSGMLFVLFLLITRYADRILRRQHGDIMAAEKRFRDIAESTADWFWEMGPDLRVSFISDRFLSDTGLSRDDIIGKTYQEFIGSEIMHEEPEKWRQYEETLKARRPFRDFEYSVNDQKGRRRYIRVSGNPVFGADGDFQGYRGAATNTTLRRLAQQAMHDAMEEAKHANMVKSEFLANMSHELRTPLNAIIGFSDAIITEIFGPMTGSEKYKEYIKNIHGSGKHLHNLINDILDVSVIEAGKLELSDDEVEFAALAEECMNQVKTRTDKNGVRLYCEIEPGFPKLIADERRLKQILINLLSNSAKFTPRGGVICLAVRLDADGSPVFSVADTGIGMSPEDIPKAMAAFGQVGDDRLRKQEGTGLGLHLCRSLIEMHGGTMTVESEKGKGTTVTVRFPKERSA